MSGYEMRKTLLIGLMSAALALPGLAGEPDLDWRRLDRLEGRERPSSGRPARRTPPRVLQVAIPHQAPPAAPGESSDEMLATRARRAAGWTARQLAQRDGRREAFRVGFYDGLHAAFADPELARWNYHDGLELGRRAPEAHRHGTDIGTDAARVAAEQAAAEKVSQQFHDLGREPQPWPHATPPPFFADLHEAREPELEEVMRDHPLSGFPHAAGVGPLPEPWSFYRYRGYRDFYDASWKDAGHALAFWLRHADVEPPPPYFKQMFRYHYPRQLAQQAEVIESTFRHGLEDGWDYGAHVHRVWKHRQGYLRGWNEALRESSETAYHRGFARFYEERYSEHFHRWSTSPRLEIGQVTLRDANDDGVFEPGEDLAVALELVNYGGAPGDFVARLSGHPLERGVNVPLAVPRRTALRSAGPLPARIDPSIRPRTAGELALALGGIERRLPLVVSYPLELDRPVRLLDHDAVAGQARIEAVVRNTSRRAVAGEIELRGGSAAGAAPGSFAAIAAGQPRRFSFELTGLAPLDLLGGAVTVELTVTSGGKTHDQLVETLPELAVDLGNRELLRFMGHLARDDAAADDVRRAQELMLRRLRADWKAAVAQSGNPYKKDFKEGSRRTALGDLVATYRADRAGLTHREVFSTLAPRIEQLAKSMPGGHPFLRRSMKKLARQLAA